MISGSLDSSSSYASRILSVAVQPIWSVYVSSSSSIFFALRPSLILILRPFFLAGGFFLLGFPDGFCGLPFGTGLFPLAGRLPLGSGVPFDLGRD